MEIEEAAMIDGCNPIQIFFKVVFPILKPTMISTAILETMCCLLYTSAIQSAQNQLRMLCNFHENTFGLLIFYANYAIL